MLFIVSRLLRMNFSISQSVEKYLCVGTCRARQLEKELAVLKEKIHHLDDMLKSQQRKVRHMIEQVGAHMRSSFLTLTASYVGAGLTHTL